jgi:hypothetical protein
MSKLIAKFPNEVPGRGQAHISISMGGVEIDWSLSERWEWSFSGRLSREVVLGGLSFD